MILENELREVNEDIEDLSKLWETYESVGERQNWLDRVLGRMEDRRAKLVLARKTWTEADPEPESLTDIEPVLTFPEIADFINNLLRRGLPE